MNYQVHITKTAEHDIAKAADYIEFVLKNPQAANGAAPITHSHPVTSCPVMSRIPK